MNFEEILKEPRTYIYFGSPKTLTKLIEDYQENEKKRHSRKSQSKAQLVVLMMAIGRNEFKKRSDKMKKEFENYQS